MSCIDSPPLRPNVRVLTSVRPIAKRVIRDCRIRHLCICFMMLFLIRGPFLYLFIGRLVGNPFCIQLMTCLFAMLHSFSLAYIHLCIRFMSDSVGRFVVSAVCFCYSRRTVACVRDIGICFGMPSLLCPAIFTVVSA